MAEPGTLKKCNDPCCWYRIAYFKMIKRKKELQRRK